MELKTKFASESGHWYRKDGTPAYTVIGKNGKERNTTLRDARKEGLYPSVTTVLKCAAAPGLERWKQQNLLMAAMTLPKIEGESADDYMNRVIKDAADQAEKARDKGTKIHGSLEKAYLCQPYPSEDRVYVQAVFEAIGKHFGEQEWSAEKSFASSLGYGGKIDLHAPGIVIDFKTSEFDPDEIKIGYDEHRMQLSAYANGLDMKYGYRAANVFVSTSHPGHVQIFEWQQEEMFEAWAMFSHLLTYWQIKNRYQP